MREYPRIVHYVRRFSLNLLRDLIGNQCSDLSRGLDSESLLDLVTTRAGRGRFERNKNVSSPSTCESQYCGEPP